VKIGSHATNGDIEIVISPLSAGTLLENRYRILRPLGQGGMSQVYLAEDTRLGVRVAIKENLQTGSAAQSQFREEARILAGLSHPNLPRVSDHFIDSRTGRQYLVMDYVEGEDLEQIIERQGPLPEATALAWIRQVMDALAYLHSQRPPVIHRDVKPGNIKITPQGKAILVDFGISKVYDPGTPTLTGAQAITPGYAAPEQYGLRTDERSDIYSLGATLYTTLTGEKPPPSPVLMTKAERLTPPRAIVPSISRGVESVVLRAMEPDTSRRWPSMRAFKSELLKAARSRRSPARRRIPGWVFASLALGSILLLVVLVATMGRSGNGEPNTPQAPSGVTEVAVVGPVAPSPTSTISHTRIPSPVGIATPTPAPTATPTSLPTGTPTMSPTPTQTPTPTSPPTATTTSTRILTLTPTPRPPTRTFTPTGPPAVELLEPQDGAQVQGEVTFRWSWAGRLGPGEIFDVRVCKGEGCQPQFGKTNVGDTTWPWQPDEGGGTYGWQVVVIRKEGDRVVAERAHSDIWRFDWSSGGGGSTTAPGPTPTR